MEPNEQEKMCGRYNIEARDAVTGELLRLWSIDNTLTLINQTIRSQMLLGTYAGSIDALKIKYFAFGTNSTIPTVNDVALGTEVFRKQITTISQINASTVQSVVSLGAQECNFDIREIGVFCGPAATNTPGSGTMISRIATNISKNTNIVLNIVRSDICTI